MCTNEPYLCISLSLYIYIYIYIYTSYAYTCVCTYMLLYAPSIASAAGQR